MTEGEISFPWDVVIDRSGFPLTLHRVSSRFISCGFAILFVNTLPYTYTHESGCRSGGTTASLLPHGAMSFLSRLISAFWRQSYNCSSRIACNRKIGSVFWSGMTNWENRTYFLWLIGVFIGAQTLGVPASSLTRPSVQAELDLHVLVCLTRQARCKLSVVPLPDRQDASCQFLKFPLLQYALLRDRCTTGDQELG